jgi:hypothetical protein
MENISKRLIIKEKEIWWTYLGLNPWTEACWKWEKFRRPVLVLKKLSYFLEIKKRLKQLLNL